MSKLDARLARLEREQASPLSVEVAWDEEATPGVNAAELIRAWRDGVTAVWLPDDYDDDLQAERGTE